MTDLDRFTVKWDENRVGGLYETEQLLIRVNCENEELSMYNMMSHTILTMLYDPDEEKYVSSPLEMAFWARENLSSKRKILKLFTEVRNQYVDSLLINGQYENYAIELKSLTEWKDELEKVLGEKL